MLRVLLEMEVLKNVKKNICAINKGNADYMEEMDVIVYTMR